MVARYIPKVGDIITINFSPQVGHEQAGHRPALIVSHHSFNKKTGLALMCPITNTDNGFLYHVPLSNKIKTTGFVMVEHMKSFDFTVRKVKFIENIDSKTVREVKQLISLTIN